MVHLANQTLYQNGAQMTDTTERLTIGRIEILRVQLKRTWRGFIEDSDIDELCDLALQALERNVAAEAVAPAPNAGQPSTDTVRLGSEFATPHSVTHDLMQHSDAAGLAGAAPEGSFYDAITDAPSYPAFSLASAAPEVGELVAVPRKLLLAIRECKDIPHELYEAIRDRSVADTLSRPAVSEAMTEQRARELYVTANPQKDGRLVLGTAVHKYRDCQTLKRRQVETIDGSVAELLPKCHFCYERVTK